MPLPPVNNHSSSSSVSSSDSEPSTPKGATASPAFSKAKLRMTPDVTQSRVQRRTLRLQALVERARLGEEEHRVALLQREHPVSAGEWDAAGSDRARLQDLAARAQRSGQYQPSTPTQGAIEYLNSFCYQQPSFGAVHEIRPVLPQEWDEVDLSDRAAVQRLIQKSQLIQRMADYRLSHLPSAQSATNALARLGELRAEINALDTHADPSDDALIQSRAQALVQTQDTFVAHMVTTTDESDDDTPHYQSSFARQRRSESRTDPDRYMAYLVSTTDESEGEDVQGAEAPRRSRQRIQRLAHSESAASAHSPQPTQPAAVQFSATSARQGTQRRGRSASPVYSPSAASLSAPRQTRARSASPSVKSLIERFESASKKDVDKK